MRVNTRNARHSPDVYFATYQVLDTADSNVDIEADPNEVQDLLRNYPQDFFDLVIVDECHRGSARAESEWRGILDYFHSAVQLGLTATPVDRKGTDTYGYFGNPVYTYSLAEGIEDGFLAPYTIRRVVFDIDADGFEVVDGLRDISGRDIPAGTYGTKDYERRLRLPDRTTAMAIRIAQIVGDTTDRAVIFCVDAEHARVMCEQLRSIRPDRTQIEPEWVSRIMSVEREKNRLLEEFTDPERDVPQVAVTSSLLSTGVDIEDLKYVIICRTIGSMPEFKQIIGRGTRLYPEKGKSEFEIVDFVGATEKFRDSKFDGPPLKRPAVEIVSDEGDLVEVSDEGSSTSQDGDSSIAGPGGESDDKSAPGGDFGNDAELRDDHRHQETFELRGVPVSLVSEGFWVHDIDSGKPRLVRYVDWVTERVLEHFEGPESLLIAWSDPRTRSEVVNFLMRSRIDVARLTAEFGNGDADEIDTVDQLLHLAWGLPTMTRRERANRARNQHQAELDTFARDARQVLTMLMERYAEAGIDEIEAPTVVQVPPLSDVGSPTEIASRFGGAAGWHRAREAAQRWLYSA